MQNLNIKEWLQQGEKEFEEKFPIFTVDSLYNEPVIIKEGLVDDIACGHNEIRKILLDWHKQRQISLIKMIVEDGRKFSEEQNPYDTIALDKFLDTISSKLNSLIQ